MGADLSVALSSTAVREPVGRQYNINMSYMPIILFCNLRFNYKETNMSVLSIYYFHLFLCPKLSGMHQLGPTNILGPLPTTEDAGPSCHETLYICLFLYVPKHGRKSPSFPLSPFSLGTWMSYLFLPSSNGWMSRTNWGKRLY